MRWQSLVIYLQVAVANLAAGGGEADWKADLEERRKVFEELKQDIPTEMEKFRARYVEEIKANRARAQEAANLDLVVALLKEEEEFLTRDRFAMLSDIPEVSRLQEIYLRETEAIAERQKVRLDGLVEGYRKQIGEVVAELTRKSEIEAAVEVKKELDWIDEDYKAELTKLGYFGNGTRMGMTGIWVLEARYGSNGQHDQRKAKDVTAAANRRIRDGRLVIGRNQMNHIFGDPHPFHIKRLSLKYLVDGKPGKNGKPFHNPWYWEDRDMAAP